MFAEEDSWAARMTCRLPADDAVIVRSDVDADVLCVKQAW